MENLLEFLNQQSGDRLVGYSIVLLIFTYYVTQALMYIFKCIFIRKKLF